MPIHQHASESKLLSLRSLVRQAWRMSACLFFAFCWMTCGAVAQEQFELAAPGLGAKSFAELTAGELRVTDDAGNLTRYARSAKWDSADGAWFGFESSSAGQIIRWPASGSGPMMIGRRAGGTMEFRASQMQVRRIGGLANPLNPGAVVPPGMIGGGVGLPGAGLGAGGPLQPSDFFQQIALQQKPAPQILQLVNRDDRNQVGYLGHAFGQRPQVLPLPQADSTEWLVVPAGPGLIRLQQNIGGVWLAIATNPLRTVNLVPVAQSADQLFRVTPSTFVANRYWIESVTHPGWALLSAPGGDVLLEPIAGQVTQVWIPLLPANPVAVEPLWKSVSQEVRANPPLPPARIQVTNTHKNALMILIADRRNSSVNKVRVEPGSSTEAIFERDPGATIVETYELRSPSGVWDRQQFVTPIPPAVWYDVSVYEEFLQSIAIDRTGTSPNVIEDINYQPKSVGFVVIPPGNALPEFGRFDAFAKATEANNPGAVRRLDPKSLEKASAKGDPLEAILQGLPAAGKANPTPAQPGPDRRKF